MTRRTTRERLMTAAAELFGSRGIIATTTMEVARRAGVSHGSVFAHFGSRDRLVIDVVEAIGRRIAERTHERSGAGHGLRAVLEAHLAVLAENEGLYARLVTEASLLPGEARTTLVAVNSALSLHLAQAAPRSEAPHLVFNTWIALVHYYLANRDLFAPGGSVIERCGTELVDYYLGLVAPTGGTG